MITVKGYALGKVQGVGFRYFVRRSAEAHQVNGYAKNLADGRVEFLLQGNQTDVDAVVEKIRQGPDYARVEDVSLTPVDKASAQNGFRTY